MRKASSGPRKPSIFSLLKPYKGLIILLLFFALISNGVNLLLPKIVANGIDAYTNGNFDINAILIKFSVAILFVFLFTFLQSIIQTYASEKVARDLRTQLADQISRQSNAYIEQANPSKLLTNLTADVDSIKLFIAQAIVSITSSIFIIIGASILLLSINWKLALAIIIILPKYWTAD
ncbi:MAG: ABC transporter transmembrane domain-containing protein [Candidatus Pedobacter colombiensis]|uniref:ABC transporter transmembrane domain-containing protein n=1 Tax=Candidatus Pedobacter colombiensis TaxID=3121371 RepID=A0AAJ6B7V9_9SPHI|nr:ABC transporter transmembrane domain-containing protein [Pedobacter sp.]WEK21527.1 MAG: ABC transporter transmembrane domain-containing protein [Pedobacter sp.]